MGVKVMASIITREELREKMEGNGVRLVEALPEEAFQRCHLPGAINIPPGKVQERAGISLPDQQAEIVVYCTGST